MIVIKFKEPGQHTLQKAKLAVSHYSKESTGSISDDLLIHIQCQFRNDIGFLPPFTLQKDAIHIVTVDKTKYNVKIKKLWDDQGKTIPSGTSFSGLLTWEFTTL